MATWRDPKIRSGAARREPVLLHLRSGFDHLGVAPFIAGRFLRRIGALRTHPRGTSARAPHAGRAHRQGRRPAAIGRTSSVRPDEAIGRSDARPWLDCRRAARCRQTYLMRDISLRAKIRSAGRRRSPERSADFSRASSVMVGLCVASSPNAAAAWSAGAAEFEATPGLQPGSPPATSGEMETRRVRRPAKIGW